MMKLRYLTYQAQMSKLMQISINTEHFKNGRKQKLPYHVRRGSHEPEGTWDYREASVAKSAIWLRCQQSGSNLLLQ